MSEVATTRGTIEQALLAFHTDAGELDLAKNRSGHNAEYLDLDKAMEQIRPLLAKHELFVRHRTDFGDGVGWHVQTVVVHGPTGESLPSGPYPLHPTKNDAQGWGGALTYARRYTLLAVLGLVADNDDDGTPKRQRSSRAPSGKINAAQRTELMAEIRAAKISIDSAKTIVKDVAGVEATEEIPAEKFKAVVAAIKAAKP